MHSRPTPQIHPCQVHEKVAAVLVMLTTTEKKQMFQVLWSNLRAIARHSSVVSQTEDARNIIFFESVCKANAGTSAGQVRQLLHDEELLTLTSANPDS